MLCNLALPFDLAHCLIDDLLLIRVHETLRFRRIKALRRASKLPKTLLKGLLGSGKPWLLCSLCGLLGSGELSPDALLKTGLESSGLRGPRGFHARGLCTLKARLRSGKLSSLSSGQGSLNALFKPRLL